MTELQLRTDFHLLLLSLIVGELLLTVYGIPMDAGASYRSSTQQPVQSTSMVLRVWLCRFGWKFGRNLCIATGFIHTCLGKYYYL